MRDHEISFYRKGGVKMRDYRNFNGADPGTAFKARDQYRMYWPRQMRFDRMLYPEGDTPLFGVTVIVILILLYLWFTTSASGKVKYYDDLDVAMKEATSFYEELQGVYQDQQDCREQFIYEQYVETDHQFRLEAKGDKLVKLTNTLEFTSKEMVISIRKDYQQEITCFSFMKKVFLNMPMVG